MEFNNTRVINFEGAFRGLRNPLESWSKSDSAHFMGYELTYKVDEVINHWIDNEIGQHEKISDEKYDELFNKYYNWLSEIGTLHVTEEGAEEVFYMGPMDLNLAQRMIQAGSSDRKFMRQIMVSVDITAPLYFLKELDTYKIGTVANSTSTMHKLSSTPITRTCFEMDDLDNNLIMFDNNEPYSPNLSVSEYWDTLINDLEYLRKKYNNTKDKRYWKELIRLLPESWLQTRTWTANYEILRNIYSQRKNHRLAEWHTFCEWITTLPYANELILYKLD